jgi:hypothetical protein
VVVILNEKNKNLTSFNEMDDSKHREISSKGGKASGISRSFQSAFRKKVKDNPELFDELRDVVIEKALSGDPKFMELFIDLMGESVQRESLKLKRKEIRIKEQELKAKADEKEASGSFEDVIVSAYEKRMKNDNK